MTKQFKSFPKKDNLMCCLIPRLVFAESADKTAPPQKILQSSVTKKCTDCDDFFSTRQNNTWSKISKTLSALGNEANCI